MVPKKNVPKKYEEFYPWWEANWEKGIPSWHKGKVDYDTWRSADYGIKRLEGMLNFMESEDWSNRLPEFREYINLMDQRRGTDFRKTFPRWQELWMNNEPQQNHPSIVYILIHSNPSVNGWYKSCCNSPAGIKMLQLKTLH